MPVVYVFGDFCFFAIYQFKTYWAIKMKVKVKQFVQSIGANIYNVNGGEKGFIR